LPPQVPATILEIDVENQVEYDLDVLDLSKWATDPNVTRNNPPKNFDFVAGLADIVAVNGAQAKGALAFRVWALIASSAPAPGGNIADISATSFRSLVLEVLKSDGTPVGTITAQGFGGNNVAPPPGAPLSATAFNFAITGGTGAYLGARGQLVRGRVTIGARVASITEDPANRRINGGGKIRWIAHLLPVSTPSIITTAAGPAVFHSDFTPVSAAKPVKPGEILVLFASGLGPTRPGVDPGQPFTADPLQVANSPVQVFINGKAGDVLYAGGYPGTVDSYQVNFRVPDGTAAGQASIQLTAAWIAGPSVNTAVQ
jgi:hypothetical protein